MNRGVDAVLPVVVGAEPQVTVPAFEVRPLALGLTRYRELVPAPEQVRRDPDSFRFAVAAACIDIAVAWIAGVFGKYVDKGLEGADSRHGEPVQPRAFEYAAVSRHRIEDGEAERGVRCVPRVDRIEVKDACHAIAVAHREAAGVDLGFAEQLGIQHAEYVVVSGQVKGFP